MPSDRTLLSLDASHAIPTRVLRFEDSRLRRRTPVLLTSQTSTHRSDWSRAVAAPSSVLRSWLCGSTKEPSGFLVNHRKPRELGVASTNRHSWLGSHVVPAWPWFWGSTKKPSMTSSCCSCHHAARTWPRWPLGPSNEAYLSSPHLEASPATTMAKPHKLHARTTILIIRPSQTPRSTSCHVKATEPCVYFYIWDFSLVDIMQRFRTQSKLNLAHMTWEHIFQAFYISFSDSNLVHEMSLRQKELLPLHKIKQGG
jgi:hypothetical protein